MEKVAKKFETKREILRVAGKLREIVTIKDSAGTIIHKFMNPVMLEFRPRDAIQIMVGASILAIPVGFTEEVWNLGNNLPLVNIFYVLFLSLLFISVFVYYSYYRNAMKDHWDEFLKRVISTYVFSFAVVALLLTIIHVTPWTSDWVSSFKRTVLVTLPASLSAAVVDILK